MQPESNRTIFYCWKEIKHQTGFAHFCSVLVCSAKYWSIAGLSWSVPNICRQLLTFTQTVLLYDNEFPVRLV